MACWTESLCNIFGIHNRKHENAIYVVPLLQVSWESIETWQGYFASENWLKLKLSWGYWHCCLSHAYTILYILWKKDGCWCFVSHSETVYGAKSLKKIMVITNINTREICLHIFFYKIMFLIKCSMFYMSCHFWKQSPTTIIKGSLTVHDRPTTK